MLRTWRVIAATLSTSDQPELPLPEVRVRCLAGADLWTVRWWGRPWKMYSAAYTFWRLATPLDATTRWRYRRALRVVDPQSVMTIRPREVWAANLGAEIPEIQALVVPKALIDDGAEALMAALEQEQLGAFRSLIGRQWTETVDSPDASASSTAIIRARRYIEENFTRRLSLDDIARAAGRSRYHLARIFADKVGVSIWEYVQLTRLDRALALLREGMRPAEVACAAAFSDQAHLTRTLRETYGITPARYARAFETARLTSGAA